MSQQISYIALGAATTALVVSGLNLAITLRGPSAPEPVPPIAQCIELDEPRLTPVPDAVFSGSLCREDGTRVVLHYRAKGATDWHQADMAVRLGKRFVKLELGDEYAGGVEYWATTVEAAAGSAEQPHVAQR